MRTTPLIGEKVWFGPRRLGWGLSPVSIEGWLVSAAAMALIFVAARTWPAHPLARRLPMFALVPVAVAKGSAPGGHRARSALLATRATAE
jgi:hypothetical protein